MLSFDTSRGGLKPQNDVIIKQDLQVLVSYQNLIRYDPERFDIRKW